MEKAEITLAGQERIRAEATARLVRTMAELAQLSPEDYDATCERALDAARGAIDAGIVTQKTSTTGEVAARSGMLRAQPSCLVPALEPSSGAAASARRWRLRISS